MAAKKIILASLLLSNIPRLLANKTLQEPEQQLYLLVLLPYPNTDAGNPSWSGGPNVIPAMRLAVENVHTSGTLHGFNLSLLETDCGCNYTNRARINFIENILYSKKQIVGLIGPGCSASTVAIAPLTIQQNISLIHIHGAGSPQLGDHRQFKNSFGVYGSSQGIVATMIAMVRDKGWSKVAVLYDSTRIFQTSIHDLFIDEIFRSNNNTANVTVSSAALSDNFYHLDKIMKESIRVVLLIAGPELARNVMCTAYKRNMTYPVIQWLIIERSLIEFQHDVDFVYQHSTFSCSKDIMVNKALNGSVLITYRLANINRNSSENGVLSYDDFFNKYHNQIETRNSENNNQALHYSAWGSMYYDAVWAMALALNKSRQAGFDLHGYGRNGYRSKAETLILREVLEQKIDFQGVSGSISFDVSSGFNSRSFDISLVVNNTVLLIAYFDSDIDYLIKIDLLDENFPRVVHFTPTYATIILAIIASLILTMTIAFHALSLYYRNDYFVRAASFKLNQAAFAGCYLLLLASFILITNEGVSITDNLKASLCHTIHFLCSIGFTLLFGAVCAKAWRLFRIFTYFWKEPGRFFSDSFLLFLVVLATTMDIFLNIVWIVYDPFKIQEDQSSFDGYSVIVEKRCHSNYFQVWYLTIYLYNFIFVFISFLLTLCTKKIRISGFQTKTVLKFAYSVFLLMGIAILLQVLFRLDVNLDHIVIFIADYCSLNIAVILSMYYLFMPPVYPRLKQFLSKCF